MAHICNLSTQREGQGFKASLGYIYLSLKKKKTKEESLREEKVET